MGENMAKGLFGVLLLSRRSDPSLKGTLCDSTLRLDDGPFMKVHKTLHLFVFECLMKKQRLV